MRLAKRLCMTVSCTCHVCYLSLFDWIPTNHLRNQVSSFVSFHWQALLYFPVSLQTAFKFKHMKHVYLLTGILFSPSVQDCFVIVYSHILVYTCRYGDHILRFWLALKFMTLTVTVHNAYSLHSYTSCSSSYPSSFPFFSSSRLLLCFSKAVHWDVKENWLKG